MTSSTATRSRLPAVQRKVQILRTARQAFIEHGYRGATTADIAARCDVSEALIIKYFGPKEELFRAALVDPVLTAIRQRIEANQALLDEGRAGDVEFGTEAATEFLATWIELLRREGRAVLALVQDLREVPDAAQQLGVMLARDIDELAQTLASGLEAPTFRYVNPRMLTVSALATAAAAAFLEDDPRAFLDDYIDLITFGLLAPGR